LSVGRESGAEGVEHLSDLDALRLNGLSGFGVEVAKVSAQLDLILEFTGGACCMIEEAGEVPAVVVSGAFCDVGRDRNGAALDLIG
jgi:hypothetical protein